MEAACPRGSERRMRGRYWSDMVLEWGYVEGRFKVWEGSRPKSF
ncbi:hypothetical protein COLO4_22546 [Corchorus olitorius]|uniref:Uncharacterized protein n=1 Tax=Corchorus olitorius TaxID=93759 RepID=A0A1R3ILI8_9ROSI|nr:hypothetical protein COLO4_22546 [Corchorus olitorius]